MYKESEVNLDDIVKALLESELGFLLLQSDNNCKNMYDVLSEKPFCCSESTHKENKNIQQGGKKYGDV